MICVWHLTGLEKKKKHLDLLTLMKYHSLVLGDDTVQKGQYIIDDVFNRFILYSILTIIIASFFSLCHLSYLSQYMCHFKHIHINLIKETLTTCHHVLSVINDLPKVKV